ncbi:MAG: hypothetical protein ACT4OX_14160 [Actinomycetota bacterium]
MNFYLGPTEWMTNAWSTVEAMDAYSHFLDRYEGDITAMSISVADVLGSLDALADVVLGPGIAADDRRKLRDVRDTLQQSYTASSDEFKATNSAVLAERTAHIDQKLAQLDAVAATLTTGSAMLIPARDAIATQVRGGRSGVAWIDPDVAVAFARTSLLVQSLASGVLGTQVVAGPEPAQPKAVPFPALEERTRQLDAEPTDDEPEQDLDLGAAGRAWDTQARTEQGDIEHRRD